MKELARDDERVKLLRSIPGLGPFFSVLVAMEIDDIGRFRDEMKLCSYAGLVPSTYASGGKVFHGRITKTGNKWLRWALIEAVSGLNPGTSLSEENQEECGPGRSHYLLADAKASSSVQG